MKTRVWLRAESARGRSPADKGSSSCGLFGAPCVAGCMLSTRPALTSVVRFPHSPLR